MSPLSTRQRAALALSRAVIVDTREASVEAVSHAGDWSGAIELGRTTSRVGVASSDEPSCTGSLCAELAPVDVRLLACGTSPWSAAGWGREL